MGENSKIEWCLSRKRNFRVNPVTGKPGPCPKPPENGNKRQARQRINVEVRTGYRPHPNTLPCVDCGHVWKDGERRHEYDHAKGYGPEAHYVVESVCTLCHSKRDNPKAKSTHCTNGHLFDEKNTGRKPTGQRFCRECRRAKDRNRPNRNAEYWRNYRLKRKALHGKN